MIGKVTDCGRLEKGHKKGMPMADTPVTKFS